jgi:FkbM family methyltransferase
MRRSAKVLLSIAVFAAGAAGTGYYYYSPVRMFAIKVTGGSPQCPLSNALVAACNLKTQIRYKDEILAASKLLEKDPAGFHLWDTPMGRWWITEGDDWMLPFNLAEQEHHVYGSGRHAVQPGDVVLDCGAGVGVYTRAALARGARLVVAIEPLPENVECLRRNFAGEVAGGKVVIYPKGVWDKEDLLTIKVVPGIHTSGSFAMDFEGAQPALKLPLTTIDNLVDELKLARVDYIKMAIEGAEQQAVLGARETLRRFRPRMALCTYHRAEDPERIPELVRAAWPGYRVACGPCTHAGAAIRPDVFYFGP